MSQDGVGFPFERAVSRGREIVAIAAALIEEIEKSTTSSQRLIASGKVHEIGREFSTALLAYKASGQAPEALIRTAIVYLKIGESAKARSLARDFVEKHCDYRFADISGRPTSALTILGDANRACGDLAAAEEAYAEGLALVPGDSQAAGQLAHLHLFNNQVEQAVALTERFLDEDDMQALRATTRLLTNDPNRLPAVAGLVNSFSAKLANVR